MYIQEVLNYYEYQVRTHPSLPEANYVKLRYVPVYGRYVRMEVCIVPQDTYLQGTRIRQGKETPS